ncbi:MAG: hypothetical protein WKG00_25330 [Polyangiaceae bacterium]
MAPLIFRLDGSTWRFRLRMYVVSLTRPRQLALIGLIAFFPLLIERVTALALADPGLDPIVFLVIGLVGVVLLWLLGALVAVLRRSPPSTLVVDDASIRERVGDRTIEHPWTWVVEALEDERTVTLTCAGSMKSFRLSSGAPRRLLVLPRTDAAVAQLLSVLEAHERPVLRHRARRRTGR